jgi:hypothetical protein
MDDGFTSSTDESESIEDEEMSSVEKEEFIELSPKEELLFRFKLIKKHYMLRSIDIPEDLEHKDLEDLQSLYRETIHKINTEQKANYVNTIKSIYKLMQRDHPKELDDPKYIEGVTSEEIQELCKGIDLEQMGNVYAIVKTVAIASSKPGETSGCSIQ